MVNSWIKSSNCLINITGDLDARIVAEADARGAEDKALSDRFVTKKHLWELELGNFVSKRIKHM